MGDLESTHVSPEQYLVARLVNGHSYDDGVGSGVRKIVETDGGRTWFFSLLHFPRESGRAGEFPPSPERVNG